MWEIFTIGGAEYLMNVFNAIAAWTGGGGFRSLVSVVMVLGFAYALLTMAMNMDWRVLWNWFITSTLIYMVLLVPTTTVKITDRTDAAAGGTVANVPLGLAAIASVSSTAGDWMTRTAETLFVMPGALAFSSNGMIYGARLLDKTYDYEFGDPALYANLQEYNQSCLFYDILLNPSLAKKVTESKDLLTDLGDGSVSKAMKFIKHEDADTDISEIRTCKDGLTGIRAQVLGAEEASIQTLAKKTYPRMANAAAKSKLESDLPQLHDAVFGTSGSDTKVILRQKAMVDTFSRALYNFGNPDLDALAAERADIQANNTYASITSQAMTWVPILNIVLSIIFYAMFPVLFPLFLLPQTGVATLKGYMTGFFYLSAWGPLYAVLHMILQTKLGSDLGAVSPGGMSPATFHRIKAIDGDIANLAGFLMMSVPFIAAGMAKGAMSISGHAMSMLSPAQRAAEDAASERTTGNYSYGNRSFANMSAFNNQSMQWQSAPSMDYGGSRDSFRDGHGLRTNSFRRGADSLTVYDSGEAMGRSPISINSSFANSERLEEAESRAAVARQGAVTQWTARHSSGARDGVTVTDGTANVSGRTASNGTTTTNTVGVGSSYTDARTKGASTVISAGKGERTEDSNFVGREEGTRQSDTYASSIGARANIGVSSGGGKGSGKAPSGILSAAASALGITAGAEGYGDVRATKTTDIGTTQNSGARQGYTKVTNNDLTNTHNNGATETDVPYRETRDYSEQLNDSGGQFARGEDSHGVSASADRYSADEKALLRQYQDASDIESRVSRLRSMSAEERMAVSEDLTPLVTGLYMERRSEKPWLPDIRDPNLSSAGRMARDKEVGEILSGLVSERGSLGDQLDGILGSGTQGYNYDAIAKNLNAEIARQRTQIGSPDSHVARPSFVRPTTPEALRTITHAPPEGIPGAPMSGPVETVLPRSGQGFRSYARAGNQFGTQGMIGELLESSREWASKGHAPVGIGDISVRGGGPIDGHEGHRSGRQVDLRPFRKDG